MSGCFPLVHTFIELYLYCDSIKCRATNGICSLRVASTSGWVACTSVKILPAGAQATVVGKNRQTLFGTRTDRRIHCFSMLSFFLLCLVLVCSELPRDCTKLGPELKFCTQKKGISLTIWLGGPSPAAKDLLAAATYNGMRNSH